MPLPDGYLPRKGDVLVIHATVKYDVETSDDSIHVVPADRHSSVLIKRSDIVGLHCKKWEPGDLARHDDVAVEVIAIDGDEVWIRVSNPDQTILNPRKVVSANELSAEPVPQDSDTAES